MIPEDTWRGGPARSERAALPRSLEALAAQGEPTQFRAGQTIFIEGETSGRVVLVRDGHLRVSTARGGRDRPVAVVGPGAVLGEVSAIDGEPHGATVVAIEPVDAVVVSEAEFRDFLSSSPEASLWLLRSMLRRLRETERRRVEFVPIDAVGRVARALVELARGGSQSVVSRADVVAASGVPDDRVPAAIRGLRARGWIRTIRDQVQVLDVEALRRRAG